MDNRKSFLCSCISYLFSCITAWFLTVVVHKDHLRSFLKRFISRSHRQKFKFSYLGWILNVRILKMSSRNFNGISRVKEKCPRESPVCTWFFKPSQLFPSQTLCPDCLGQRLYSLLWRLRSPNRNYFTLRLWQKK